MAAWQRQVSIAGAEASFLLVTQSSTNNRLIKRMIDWFQRSSYFARIDRWSIAESHSLSQITNSNVKKIKLLDYSQLFYILVLPIKLFIVACNYEVTWSFTDDIYYVTVIVTIYTTISGQWSAVCLLWMWPSFATFTYVNNNERSRARSQGHKLMIEITKNFAHAHHYI